MKMRIMQLKLNFKLKQLSQILSANLDRKLL